MIRNFNSFCKLSVGTVRNRDGSRLQNGPTEVWTTLKDMYETCPECDYRRQASDEGPLDRCPRCGLIFSKWMKTRFHVDTTVPGKEESTARFFQRLKATVLYVPSPIDPLVFYGRLLLYVAFVVWGFRFIQMSFTTNEIGASFMHNVNLVFHEAGHWIFRPFGNFITVLGGTLGQLLMPLIALIALIRQNRDNFGASLGLWWFAQSMMDVAPYVNDARAGQLMLLGGVTGRDMPGVHDWHNILSTLGWLHLDHRIAAGIDFTGELLMWLAFLWGGYILYLQRRELRR